LSTGRSLRPYDPLGSVEARLPYERAPYEALVTAVLAWSNPSLPPHDYLQIALQLTGHARAVAADILRHADQPHRGGRNCAAAAALGYATERLASLPLQGTAACVQTRARLVRILHTWLDGLTTTRSSPDHASGRVGARLSA